MHGHDRHNAIFVIVHTMYRDIRPICNLISMVKTANLDEGKLKHLIQKKFYKDAIQKSPTASKVLLFIVIFPASLKGK